MNKLGEYLDQMRQKHPRLSKRQMALSVGLSENAVAQIIRGEMGARPTTLKALADQWGTPDDYRAMMQLAGHPLPNDQNTSLDIDTQQLLSNYQQLTPQAQVQVRTLINSLLQHQSKGDSP